MRSAELDAFVAFGLRDHVDERQLQDASPHCGIVRVDAGPVVRGEPQLEDGPELERFAVQEPGGDGVASGEELQESFCERLPVVDLDADHEAGTGEPGHVVANPGIAVALQERLEVSGGCVVAQHAADGLELRALARRGRPVREEQHLLRCVARERVSDRAAVESDEVAVAGRDPVEEPLPQLVAGVRVIDDRGDLREEVPGGGARADRRSAGRSCRSPH